MPVLRIPPLCKYCKRETAVEDWTDEGIFKGWKSLNHTCREIRKVERMQREYNELINRS
jgi:hypothetical protein